MSGQQLNSFNAGLVTNLQPKTTFLLCFYLLKAFIFLDLGHELCHHFTLFVHDILTPLPPHTHTKPQVHPDRFGLNVIRIQDLELNNGFIRTIKKGRTLYQGIQENCRL